MRTIYRVEHRTGRYGPYNGSPDSRSPGPAADFDHDEFSGRPCLTGSERDKVPGLRHGSAFLFGFQTPALLMRWFTKEEMTIMRSAGYCVVAYRVSVEALLLSTDEQCVFDRTNATRILPN